MIMEELCPVIRNSRICHEQFNVKLDVTNVEIVQLGYVKSIHL